MLVSIHAPTKGATSRRKRKAQKAQVSIHAPTKGATNQIINILRKHMFQSTLPRRERQLIDSQIKEVEQFQSTLPRRERLAGESNLYLDNCFNPRSHEGSDYAAHQIAEGFCGFNPRSHEGSDSRYSTRAPVPSAFQSTLPRRERLKGERRWRD